MAELLSGELLQPSLLDRLTDEHPEQRVESRERRVLSGRQLRRCVLRDLAWLLNTINLEATEDLSDYPLAARSVINFGLGGFAGRTASGFDAAVAERAVREAIVSYEPRILPDTLVVRATIDRESARPNALVFEIEGELWATPVPESLYLKTTLDLEDGAFVVDGA